VSTPTDRQTPSDRILGEGLQKLDIKLPLRVKPGLGQDNVWDRLIAVFGRWRHDEGEDLIDLQDYAHIPNGPGIVLVSKRWVLSVDWRGGKPGVLLSTRRRLEGTLLERFVQATRLLLDKAARLLGEAEMKDAATADCGELSIAVNDRLLFPETDESDAELRPVVNALAAKLYAGAGCDIERLSSAARLSYRIRARGAGATVDDLAARLRG
jgi:hypothetical protein